MPPKVAAITMAYNEPALLPVWARHYGRQVGADYCYVVDHGSTEWAELPAGVNRVRLPRSAHDEARRARFMSGFVASLLEYYDWVLCTGVDEIVLADPRYFPDIPSYCGAALAGTVSAIGFDVQHVPALEPPLDLAAPVGAQRGWARFTSAMCKPVLTRQTLRWAPGFHCSDQTLVFGPLYLFHLHWADRATGLQRLARSRGMAWAEGDFAAHERLEDAQWTALFDAMAAMPRIGAVDFDPAAPLVRDCLRRLTDSGRGRERETYRFDLNVNGDQLWAIPDAFRARL